MRRVDSIFEADFVEPWEAPLAPTSRAAYRRDLSEFAAYASIQTPSRMADIDAAHDWFRTRTPRLARRFAAAWRSYVMAASDAGHITAPQAAAACSPIVFEECRFEPERLDFLFKSEGADVRLARAIALTGMPVPCLVRLSPGHADPTAKDGHWMRFRMVQPGLVRQWSVPSFLLPAAYANEVPYFATKRKTPYSDSALRLLLLQIGKALNTRAVGFALRVSYVASAMRFGIPRGDAIMAAEGFLPEHQKEAILHVSGYYCRRYFGHMTLIPSKELAVFGFSG
jgi:hypothetical protein